MLGHFFVLVFFESCIIRERFLAIRQSRFEVFLPGCLLVCGEAKKVPFTQGSPGSGGSALRAPEFKSLGTLKRLLPRTLYLCEIWLGSVGLHAQLGCLMYQILVNQRRAPWPCQPKVSPSDRAARFKAPLPAPRPPPPPSPSPTSSKASPSLSSL